MLRGSVLSYVGTCPLSKSHGHFHRYIQNHARTPESSKSRDRLTSYCPESQITPKDSEAYETKERISIWLSHLQPLFSISSATGANGNSRYLGHKGSEIRSGCWLSWTYCPRGDLAGGECHTPDHMQSVSETASILARPRITSEPMSGTLVRWSPSHSTPNSLVYTVVNL